MAQKEDDFILSAAALGLGVLLAQIIDNTLKAHPQLGWGLRYDFASQQKKVDQSAHQTPVKGPQHQRSDIHRLCSGKCKPHSCDTQGFCIDENCGALIHCPEHEKREKQPSSKSDDKKHKSGKCLPNSCDSQNFCIDSGSYEVIRKSEVLLRLYQCRVDLVQAQIQVEL